MRLGLGRTVAVALTVFLVLAAVASAAAPSSATGPLAGAARVGATPVSVQMPLRLSLTDRSAALQRFAMAVSTPGSPQYGQYESIPALARRFGATPTAIGATVGFLKRAGATQVSIDATGLFVDATLRAGAAERMFSTSLARFRSARSTFIAPVSEPSIPAALRGSVTGVVGLDTRPVASSQSLSQATAAERAAARREPASTANPIASNPISRAAAAQASSAYPRASGTGAGCSGALASGGFTPNQYLTAYGFNPLHAAGFNGRGERVALIEIDGFKRSDIRAFAGCFGLRVPPITLFGVAGLRRSLPAQGEATLDLEVLDAAAPGLGQVDVYESSANERTSLAALTAPLQNPGYKPDVISASIGLCEAAAYIAGRRVLRNTEDALAESAASGISFLNSSGDSGSADCVQGNNIVPRLAVNFPTSSSFVTGVGGTNVTLNAANAITGQLVWNDTRLQPGSAGGGGASAIVRKPRYQDAVDAGKTRLVPDVAMLADVLPGYAIYCSTRKACVTAGDSSPWRTVGGTSAATPLLAGGFALIDQALRGHQQQDLGLANPLLYAIGATPPLASAVFSDVTGYGNDIGRDVFGKPLGCCSAHLGYDEASGWGSVNLASFANVALAKQPVVVNVSLSLPRRQRPVTARRIKATVACSGRCLIGAYAVVHIGHRKPFTVLSSLNSLRGAGHKTISIDFRKTVLGRLRAAVRDHSRITADVVGAIVDPAGNVERRTGAERLKIRS